MNLLRIVVCSTFILFSATALNAQVAGKVTGNVFDASGGAIPAATVNLEFPDGGAVLFTTETTPAGSFTIPTVPANTYELVVAAPGFLKAVISNLKVDAGRSTDIPAIKLEIQGVTQSVEVTEAGTAVQTSNAEVSTTIAKTQIANLPTLNRSPLAFLQTQAGINYGAGATTINGQRSTYVNVTIDGVNIQDNYIRTNDMDFLPNLLLLDQVAEVTVSSSNASAAAGGGSSQVSFITPSGGNNLHGNGYWSNRNNYFAANTWFNNRSRTPIPFLNQNQLGGSLSGPAIKNKLFYFVNYEAFRLSQQTSVQTTVLTPDARNGIFTYKDSGGNIQRVNVLQAMGVQADPAMAGLLANVPNEFNNFDAGDSSASFLRNTAGYRFNQRNNRTRNNLTAKADYAMSPKNSFTLTYMYNTDFLDRGDTLITFEKVPTVQNDNNTTFVSGAWRYNPLPTVTNELRFGMNLAPGLFIASQESPGYYISTVTPSTIITNPQNSFRSQGRYTNTYVFSDNANRVHGAHTFEFGAQSQIVRIENFNDAGITPTMNIGIGVNPALTSTQLPGISSTDLTRANNILALLAGYVASYTQTFNVTGRTSGFVKGATNMRHWQQDNYALYLQDSWKLNRRLTATLGVRWDYYLPVNERDALSLLPVVRNNNAITTILDRDASLDFAGNAVGRPLYNADKNNFAPNIGLAWDPTGEAKWSVRAGYSLSFVNDSVVQSINNSQNTNSGLQQVVTGTGTPMSLANLPKISSPGFKVPRTLADNYLLNTQAAAAMPDPGLVTPYVQQWNVGVQRTIKSTLIDVRYVGNHGTKEIRGIDYNQVVTDQLLPDFLKAQKNGWLAQSATGRFDPAYNASIAGSQPIPFFSQLAGGGRLTDANVISYLQTGQVGELANYYQINKFNGSANFYRNPSVLGANMLTNYSNSTFNALQVDVMHRFARNFQLQANYQYGRAYGDAQGDQQTNFEPFLDINNAKIERSRPAAYDNTHVFKANGYWELPFGRNRFFHSSNSIAAKFMEGWNVAGIYTKQSGAPFGIYSARGTLNRSGRSTYNTMNTLMDKGQLDAFWQFRMTPTGPMMVPDSAKNPKDGSAVAADGSAPFAGQAFFMPAAGTLGTLQRNYFSGPWVWNLDLKVGKVTHITENKTLELRANAVNVFNHPDFFNPTTTPTSAQFGAITGTYNPSGYSRRLLQFDLYFRF